MGSAVRPAQLPSAPIAALDRRGGWVDAQARTLDPNPTLFHYTVVQAEPFYGFTRGDKR